MYRWQGVRCVSLGLGCGCASSRLIATAAGKENTNSSSRKSKLRGKKAAGVSFIQKKEMKLLKEKLLMADEGTSKNHIYKNIYPWQTPEELAEHLKNTEVYNKDGVIALNKPYGIALSKLHQSAATKKHTVVETLSSSSSSSLTHVPAMSQVLPHLRKLYDAQNLEIVKSSERWSSGLMLLSMSSEVTDKIQKCFRRSKAQVQPAMSYRAVTVGCPHPLDGASRVATKLEYVHDVGQVPVVTKKYSKNAAKSREVKPAAVEHKTLTWNTESNTSLLEMKVQVSKWHFLRVWAAHCYSPILGDHLYSGRVRMLMGRRIQVSPHNVGHGAAQNLPHSLFSMLALPTQPSEVIPCHLHLAGITLSQFNKDRSDLVISATPPEHFMWTCKQLGLLLEEEKEEEEEEESKSER